jgi:DNA polymerase-3 subunit epsilon/ATP-dependent DNA helicase DinG
MNKVTTRYVALDLETTGLDPERDEIIEVAAIAFDLEGVLAEFHSLVRPYKPPSYQIERLTGIGASALEVAPSFGAIASELADFIGSSPIVGQSVNFDPTSWCAAASCPAALPMTRSTWVRCSCRASPITA